MTLMKIFDTGASRGSDDTKLDYEAFLSPLSLQRYAEYLHKHRVQADGQLRDSDNWQKGIPFPAYMKSLWRHFHAVWMAHRGWETTTNLEEDLCAVMFNAQGYLHELLKQKEAE